MNVTFRPSRAKGTMEAPPSKSMAHRMLLCAGLAGGTTLIRNVDFSEDILATLDCLRATGAKVDCGERSVRVRGADAALWNRGFLSPEDGLHFPCRECGSTLRFFIPVGLLSGGRSLFSGSERLMARPLSVYEEICRSQGLFWQQEGQRLMVEGRPVPGQYRIPGDISSQFVSGLMFILPLLEGDSRIHLTPPVESRPYINMTMQVMEQFGVRTAWTDEETIEIPGGQSYLPRNLSVEGDYSNAAFFEAFNLTGGQVLVTGLREDSLQGDQVYREYFPILAKQDAELDISACPDLGPILMAMAARLRGGTFTGTERLRIKESDRGEAMIRELAKFGVSAERREISSGNGRSEEIRVMPGICPPKEMLDGHNDHRIVMALSVLLSETGGRLGGAEAVKKSLPDFFERIRELGIDAVMSD